jgi:hypothetical protein
MTTNSDELFPITGATGATGDTGDASVRLLLQRHRVRALPRCRRSIDEGPASRGRINDARVAPPPRVATGTPAALARLLEQACLWTM